MSFSSLSLNQSLLNQLPTTVTSPSKIQQLAIPSILQGDDLIALAQTGSGKTLAYLLPLLHKHLENLNDAKGDLQTQDSLPCPHTLIIVPTRELGTQVYSSLLSLSKPLSIPVALLSGAIHHTEQQLQLTHQPQIIVATPGRLLDQINNNKIATQTIKNVVLDEGDRLLEMGFFPDIQKIIATLPEQRQTLLFSATFAPQLKQFTQSIFTYTPKKIEVLVQQQQPAITEQCYLVNKGNQPLQSNVI